MSVKGALIVAFINIKNVALQRCVEEVKSHRLGKLLANRSSMLVFGMNTGLLSPTQDRQRGVEMGGR